MKEVTYSDYIKFLKGSKNLLTGLGMSRHKPKQLQPKNFKLEITSVWDFPEHSGWATHALNKEFRASSEPEVARNLILRYSNEGDIVLDPFVGTGTTLIECKLTRRKGIGVDINRNALILARNKLNFGCEGAHEQRTYLGDARKLTLIQDESIDLIATQPPYLKYVFSTREQVQEGDLGGFESLDEFVNEMKEVSKELFRVLKPGRCCAIQMADAKHFQKHLPVAFRVMECFLDTGFTLKGDIIKIIHHKKITSELQKISEQSKGFFLAHEHLFVFEKPQKDYKT